jgi:hypothetical protein
MATWGALRSSNQLFMNSSDSAAAQRLATGISRSSSQNLSGGSGGSAGKISFMMRHHHLLKVDPRLRR